MNRSDKRHILNVLVGRKEDDLDLEPLKSHHNYDELNAILRARIAGAAIRHGVETGGSTLDEYTHAPARMVCLSVCWLVGWRAS